ncbi:MAG TPA: signal peptidase I, partial [Lacipirellulaceae bacterium]|nr:signal peptidase I [Lacipirellulaceae bacterium]
RDAPSPGPAESDAPGTSSQFVVMRETIESIVVAFVLAFLFRTFEAEAFVIPTGSMSPSLQGRHKDVHCSQCGHRFRTTASSEDIEDAQRQSQFVNFEDAEVVGGMCPMCRYPMPYTTRLPADALAQVRAMTDVESIGRYRSYPGDRILVNKYGFDFADPQRWDVVVFKFPGDGNMNYIKRLVGLPGEEMRIFHGDVFVRALDAVDAPFEIERKPPDKVLAMLQLVHDTNYESALLAKAQWPLRWAAMTEGGWQVTAEPGEKTVAQKFTVQQDPQSPLEWLRYRHVVPERSDAWAVARSIAEGSLAELARQEGVSESEALRDWQNFARPQLVTDFNSYNARIMRGELRHRPQWDIADRHLGWHWVGDLALECEVDVAEARGALVLDVVEAGYHVQGEIDLATGAATVRIVDGRTGEALPFEARGDTPGSRPGRYRLRLANVDDQVLLWVNDKLVELDQSAYDPDALFPGGRQRMIPWASDEPDGDQGDLAPAGVGARGASLTVARLKVLRDVYYIATNEQYDDYEKLVDYPWALRPTSFEGRSIPALVDPRDLFAVPSTWPRFYKRRHVDFPIREGQLFVMGDNSPESKDSRLWREGNEETGIPGGRYLERDLLIGKALCVFWPHSWGEIPLLPKLPGWPNFGDMRLVR